MLGSRSARGVVVLLALAALPASAGADELQPPDAARTAEPRMRWFALEVNPLAAVLGRYSFNAELMTGQHLALVANPFVRYANDGTLTLSTSPEVVAGGSELGFRYYTGHDGPRGFFIGPSLIVESVSHRGGPKSAPVGFAADLGGQWVSQGGFIISGGGGLATIYDFPDIEATVFPRVLFSLGQAL